MPAVFDEKRYSATVLRPMLDAFGRQEGLPDLFARYGIDIDSEDQAEIEATVDAVNAYWNKLVNNAKYTALINQVRKDAAQGKLLAKAGDRQKLRELAKAARRETLEKRCVRLDQAMRAVAAKGYITPAEKSRIIAEFQQELSREVIEDRIRNIAVKKAQPVASPSPGLSDPVRDQIKSALAVVGKADLYQFLGTRRGDTKAVWSQRLDEEYERLKTARYSPEKTARQALLSLIKTHLINGDPGRYEQAFVFTVLTGQLEKNVMLSVDAGRINAQAFQILVGQACQLGLTAAEAEQGIAWLASRHKASVEVSVNAGGRACPVCYFLVTNESAETCPQCKASLSHVCANCRTRYFAGARDCPSCSYPQDDRRFRASLKIAEVQLEQGDIAGATASLAEAGGIWSGPATETLHARIKSRFEELRGWQSQCTEAIRRNRFVELLRLLDSAPDRNGNLVLSNGRDLKTNRDLAQKAVDGVRELTGAAWAHLRANRPDDAVLDFEAALRLVTDFADAEIGLSQCKPSPPLRLTARVERNGIRLDWEASPSPGNVVYKVYRGGPDSSEAELGATDARQWVDEHAVAGTVYRYSVRTVRKKAVSEPVVTEILANLPVQGFALTPRAGAISATWNPLPSGTRAIVRRNAISPPADINQGASVPATATGFDDGGLTDDLQYHYLVVIDYENAPQQVRYSKAERQAATPAPAPKPVKHLHLTTTAQGLRIEWPTIPRGDVAIYRSQNRPPSGWTMGSKVGISELSAWGTLIPLDGANRTECVRFPSGLSSIAPVTVLHNSLTMGAIAEYVDLPEVCRLEVLNLSSYILLTWEWPPACSFVKVAWSQDYYPASALDSSATAQRVTRWEYQQHGGFRLAAPANGKYKFAVFAGMTDGSRELYSGATSSDARAEIEVFQPVELRYQIKRSFFSKEVTLLLEPAADAGPVPDIIVVARRGDLQPHSSKDGNVVARISGVKTAAPYSHEFQLPARRPIYIRAFIESGSAYILRDPNADQLKFK